MTLLFIKFMIMTKNNNHCLMKCDGYCLRLHCILQTSKYNWPVRHRVQKTRKSRSLKKFGYTQDNALLFRPNCCPLVTALAVTLEYTVPLV